MPTDLLQASKTRRRAQERETANLVAVLLLLPLIACLVSILLSIELPGLVTPIVSVAAELPMI